MQKNIRAYSVTDSTTNNTSAFFTNSKRNASILFVEQYPSTVKRHLTIGKFEPFEIEHKQSVIFNPKQFKSRKYSFYFLPYILKHISPSSIDENTELVKAGKSINTQIIKHDITPLPLKPIRANDSRSITFYTKYCSHALHSVNASKNILARHLEASMRIQYGTLSHLDYVDFISEAKILKTIFAESLNPVTDWNATADSFGI